MGGQTLEYIFNAAGQRVSIWDPVHHWEYSGQTYWGSKPVEFYASGYAQFQHQDWLGTQRVETNNTGAVQGTYTSLPYGDAYAVSGANGDANHFAQLDFDTESGTDHAQFRQYSPTEGRWLRPDPSGGSYDASNPQSMNRYVYAANNPLSNADPSGLDWSPDEDGGDWGWDVGAGGFGYGAGTGYSGYGVDPGTDVQANLKLVDVTIWVFGWPDGTQFCDFAKNSSCSFFEESDQFNQTAQESMYVRGSLGGSGGGGGAGSNASSGPSYSHADVCAASALLNKGAGTALDILGSIPVLGNWSKGTQAVVNGVQFAGAVASAGMAVFGSRSTPTDMATSGGGLGITGAASTLPDYSMKFFGSTVKVIPFIGNLFSAGTAVNDIWGKDGMVNYYNDCMAWKN